MQCSGEANELMKPGGGGAKRAESVNKLHEEAAGHLLTLNKRLHLGRKEFRYH